jgi:hypothetical protein
MTEFKVIKINDNCYIEYKQEQFVPQCYLIIMNEHRCMKVLLYGDEELGRLMYALQECLHIASQKQKQQRR